MPPGVYLSTKEDGRIIATLDELIYGDESDQQNIAHDLINAMRDVATDLLANDDIESIGRLAISIIQ